MKAEYVDHLGDDLRVVNAARVSFDKESDWERDYEPPNADWEHQAEPHLSNKDYNLIHYLAKHNHWTPFSHCQVTLRETVPIFVARQRFKHMVGFTYNEVSRRYVDDTPEFYVPEVWRRRAENKKQGSSDEEVAFPFTCKSALGEVHACCLSYYNTLLSEGVAPEQARMVLPQSMYTSYYVTGSLAAWARAYKLRSDEHSQKEIRDLAKIWDSIISPLFPVSWDALTSG